MKHTNPWTPRRYWQVYSTDPAHTIDGFPVTTAVCSHTNRHTATACSWWRDLIAVTTTRHTPRLAYNIRRTPNHAHRIDEESGTPCTRPGHHYCPRLGTHITHLEGRL